MQSVVVPTARQRSSTFVALGCVVVAYTAIAPLSAVPLPQVPGFIPGIEGMMSIADLLTAILLFSQFADTRSRAVLYLASGFVFTAIIIVLHVSTFPGVFVPDGLIGAGPQSAAWLYIVWHLGFPVAVICYVVLKSKSGNSVRSSVSAGIFISVTIVAGVVLAVGWVVTAQNSYLPRLMVDGIRFSRLAHYVTGFDLLLTALVILLLWTRLKSILDCWLMISACALSAELALVCFAMDGRYNLGFYVAPIFSLISSLVVLAALHREVARQYSRLAQRFFLMQRERENAPLGVAGGAAAIAHEIKQPITTIALESDAARAYLNQMPPNIEEARTSLDAINESVVRSRNAIQAIRELLRSEDAQIEAVDLNDIVTEALRQMDRSTKPLGIVVEYSLTPDLPKIVGHKNQLLQVLLNVLRNAVDALESVTDRKRKIRVETDLCGPDKIVISVEDSGPGINPGAIDEIFDVFRTTRHSGMGVGLTLCRMIIQDHAGNIMAARGAMGGAQFKIFLPVASLLPIR